MILLCHITVALASIILAGIAYLSPSKVKLRMSYTLVAITFATGFYMIFSSPVHILSTCITGLVYLGVVSAAILTARHKLSLEVNKNNE